MASAGETQTDRRVRLIAFWISWDPLSRRQERALGYVQRGHRLHCALHVPATTHGGRGAVEIIRRRRFDEALKSHEARHERYPACEGLHLAGRPIQSCAEAEGAWPLHRECSVCSGPEGDRGHVDEPLTFVSPRALAKLRSQLAMSTEFCCCQWPPIRKTRTQPNHGQIAPEHAGLAPRAPRWRLLLICYCNRALYCPFMSLNVHEDDEAQEAVTSWAIA